MRQVPLPELDDPTKVVESGTHRGVRWFTKWSPPGWCVCGYAHVPEGHPWRALFVPGAHPSQFPVDAHGGLTYASEDGWLGFDTLHSGDAWPEWHICEGKVGIPGYVAEGLARFADQCTCIRWNPAMVVVETVRLADQIADVMGGGVHRT